MHGTNQAAPHTAGRVIHWAWLYDLFATAMSKGRGTLVEVAAPEPGETVLDVGCGTGAVALAIAETGVRDVTGIDPSPSMIDLARRKATKTGSDATFQVGVIEDLPFDAASFDLVTSSLMLHHLPADLKRAGLAEVRRVLKPGGRFVVMDFAHESHSRWGHLLSVMGRGRGAPTADGLVAMLAEAGFHGTQVIPTAHRNLAYVRAT